MVQVQAYCDHMKWWGWNSYPYQAPVDSFGVQSGAVNVCKVRHTDVGPPLFAEPVAKTS